MKRDTVSRARITWQGTDTPLAGLLLSPALLLLFVFTYFPMFVAVRMSLYGGRRGPGPWVGLDNYREALTSPDFWMALRVTAYYVGGVVPASLALGFVIAYGLHRVGPGRALLRTCFFIPYITSTVAAAMVWRALFNPRFGVANQVLTRLGLPAQRWLLEARGVLHLLSGGWIPDDWGPSLALCCVILFDIWHLSGFMVVVFLAALQSMPRELEEAARLDGAGSFTLATRIVLPAVRPTLLFLAVAGVCKTLQSFNSIYALTQGSAVLPETQSLIYYVYAQFYEFGYWGYGSAVAVMLTALIIVLTVLQFQALDAGRHAP
ncbi:MAG: sugar ABC transporter permease [Candidatus Hydrogenedentes bacterium]|nr:sugar ABC transporter permease [Candidatus Hydrogenedentota bacterium]